MTGNFDGIENKYLSIFKATIILLLSIALLLAVAMIGKAAVDYTKSIGENNPPEKLESPNYAIDPKNLLKMLEIASQKEDVNASAEAVNTPNPNIELANKYMDRIYEYVVTYQSRCKIKPIIDKETFSYAFHKEDFVKLLDRYGSGFAESQDLFMKSLFENERMIQICIEKEGRAKVLSGGLNFHKIEYINNIKKKIAFESQQEEMRNEFINSEKIRKSAQRDQAIFSALVALGSFAFFMSMAFVLIFSRIERNLRCLATLNKK